MRLKMRDINVDQDRDFILHMHCIGNFEADSPWARNTPYEQYEATWLATNQPQLFFQDLLRSLEEPRTIAGVWESCNKERVGFLWVTFSDIECYGIVVAEIRDIELAVEWRGQGIGSEIIGFVEDKARGFGAHILRSETGIDNTRSQRMHEKAGLSVYHLLYEKILIPSIPTR